MKEFTNKRFLETKAVLMVIKPQVLQEILLLTKINLKLD